MSNSPKISIRVSNDMLDWLNLQTNDGYKTKTEIITDILKQHKEDIQTLEDYVYNLIVKDLD